MERFLRFLKYFSGPLSLLLFGSSLMAQDLSVTAFLEPGDDNIDSGDRVTVEYAVTNSGNFDLEDVRIGFFLSSDNVYDANDVRLETEEVGDLDANETEDDSEQFEVNGSNGNYFIIAFVDYNNFVNETNENNNYAAMSITIGNGGGGGNTGKDLTMGSNLASGSAMPGPGDAIDVDYLVTNEGADDINTSFRIGFYLSDDPVYDNADTFLGKEDIDDLDGGDDEDDTETVTIPGATTPGDYYIIVVADDQAVISETDETNNNSVTAVTVAGNSSGMVDLSLTASLEPGDDSISSGDRITVDYVVTNGGTNDAEDVRIAFYFSTDNVYDAADTRIESEDVGDLDGGESESDSEQFEVNAPATGNYFIIAFADFTNAINESDETNNTVSMAINVSGSGGSGGGGGSNTGKDLSITVAAPATSAVNAGDQLDVAYEVTNDGVDDITNAFRIGFYLSSDNMYDPSDRYLSKENVDDLDSGDSEDDDETLTIPSSTAPGSYFILAVADDQEVIAESDEMNNMAAVAVTVNSGAFDLDVTAMLRAGDDSVRIGEKIDVNYTVNNLLPSDVEDVRMAFYLSADNVWDAMDTRIKTADLDDVEGNESESGEKQMTIDPAADGDYFVIAFVDHTNSITETNENNNYAVMPINVAASNGTGSTAGKDLMVTVNLAANAPNPAAGSSLKLEYEVENDGQDDIVNEFRVGFYLSADNVYDTGDVFLGKESVDDLASGDTEDDDERVTIPANTAPGSYFIIAFVDDQMDIAEANENNNYNTAIVSVGAPVGLPDMYSEVAFRIAPNPSQGEFTLVGTELFRTEATIEVYDLNGRLHKALALNGNNQSFAAYDLAPGHYILRYQDKTGKVGQQILIRQ